MIDYQVPCRVTYKFSRMREQAAAL